MLPILRVYLNNLTRTDKIIHNPTYPYNFEYIPTYYLKISSSICNFFSKHIHPYKFSPDRSMHNHFLLTYLSMIISEVHPYPYSPDQTIHIHFFRTDSSVYYPERSIYFLADSSIFLFLSEYNHIHLLQTNPSSVL